MHQLDASVLINIVSRIEIQDVARLRVTCWDLLQQCRQIPGLERGLVESRIWWQFNQWKREPYNWSLTYNDREGTKTRNLGSIVGRDQCLLYLLQYCDHSNAPNVDRCQLVMKTLIEYVNFVSFGAKQLQVCYQTGSILYSRKRLAHDLFAGPISITCYDLANVPEEYLEFTMCELMHSDTAMAAFQAFWLDKIKIKSRS